MAQITDSIAEVARKAFLVGVGAVAYGAEKTGALVDDLVKKGELTVDQGRDLNRELTVKAKDAVNGAQDTVLRARLATMSSQERAEFVARAQQLASDLDAKDKVSAAEKGDESAAADEGSSCSCGVKPAEDEQGASCSCGVEPAGEDGAKDKPADHAEE